MQTEMNVESGRSCSRIQGCESLCPQPILSDFFDSKRHDDRTRADRTWARTREWQQQLPLLVDGFLAWKAGVAHQPANDALSWDVMFVDFDGKHSLLGFSCLTMVPQ